ncbi:hypothetical protein ONE63_001095 [Megalurothrips usitatus]|uniref:PARP catalytic domain-containing protein n=1 Tax=Megalurothrips usitatus TaxID=439358 RepID=A0AAV7XER0_9NEOP|nr:hypothetical protein ONE63_001095 [Megalurothrips usitatus]
MALPSCSAVPSTAAAVSLPASTTTVMASPTALTTVAGLSASPPCARAEADSVFVFTATAASSTAATPTDPASGAAVPNTSIAPVAESNERKRKAPDDDEVEAADRNNNVLKATVVLGDVSVVAPEPKRARLDVVDVLLDEALTLLLRSGAHLVQRIRRDGAAPELGAWPWTVRCPAPVGAAQKPLRYVRLPTSSIEYQALSDAFRATCRGKGLHVTGVCRVQNDRLLRLFQDQVLRLQKGCGEVAVVRVYHGTRRDSVESICEGNLDPLLAGRASSHTRWGKGVNFSPISYYSSHYCDQQATYRSMMVCDVAMSRVCSARDIEEAPPLPEDAGRVYDTNMKLRPAAQVLCKFAKHEFYPAYVVDYKAESCGDRSAYQESDYYHQPQSRAHWPWQ